MKKRLSIIVIVLLVLWMGCFLFLPAEIRVSSVTGGKLSIFAAGRFLGDTARWQRWWPGAADGAVRKDGGFFYKGYSYRVKEIQYNQVKLSVGHAGMGPVEGVLRMGSASTDSVVIGAECLGEVRYGPAGRWNNYRRAKEIKAGLDSIIRAFRDFMADGKNVYGVRIYHAMSDDSILMTMVNYTPEYPTTASIYSMIDSVRQYIGGQGAAMHNYPLLNVSPEDGRYRVMVALSINKQLTGTRRILMKRFVPWKMIEGDVQGGAYTADRAMKQLFRYRDDYHLSIMSVPFQFLITDRRSEPDSNKWVTRVCAPIP